MSTIHSGSPSDPCPHHIFNKASSIIAPQLRMIVNSSFETATFPESWKHAEINALLKKPKADPRDLRNYRLISMLPFPDKVIEKIVNSQLTRFLEDNNTLDPSQSGFRSNHSTETALIAATDDIRTMLDRGETAALILLDLPHHLPPHPMLTPPRRRDLPQRPGLDYILLHRLNPESPPPSLLF
ncbi:hypothetical protein NDU88_002525 [Pleurodeles waltl]|uniref:Reverse transcriptase domain-containing protein n=1 Tax=Pleurodeles waltl TaxID=8319 RepID=A0AAV7RFZ6_PLEWA|nr:hypothetical protein NDU88_002525 [Pleurodeles waltl]